MRVVNTLDELLQLPRDARVNGFRARELRNSRSRRSRATRSPAHRTRSTTCKSVA